MQKQAQPLLSQLLQKYAQRKQHLIELFNHGNRTALLYQSANTPAMPISYAQLHKRSASVAQELCNFGIKKGTPVACMLGKTVETFIAALAIWRCGAVMVPLFTAFGPDAVSHRVNDCGAPLVLTSKQYASKFDTTANVKLWHCEEKYWQREQGNVQQVSEEVSGDDLLALLYTSGTTGLPKGVGIPVRALASFHMYMRMGLDVQDNDMFWNIADPAWAYGLYYTLMGPMLLGQSTILLNRPFDAKQVLQTMSEYKVTNFTGAPTVYRAIKALGEEQAKQYLYHLRTCSSAGEPLNPEVISYFEKLWNVTIRDHYGQTEFGMAVCNHQHESMRMPLKHGSMGVNMPGFTTKILNAHGIPVLNQDGNLAIQRSTSPLHWFQGYYKNEAKSNERLQQFADYDMTGDVARMDEQGYIFFAGRNDDMIKSSGYKISPFEVESELMKHAAVAECAVVGKEDSLRGVLVKAYVVPRFPVAAEELQQFVKQNLSAHEYPREIEFVKELPKTTSGKIQRFVLRK